MSEPRRRSGPPMRASEDGESSLAKRPAKNHHQGKTMLDATRRQDHAGTRTRRIPSPSADPTTESRKDEAQPISTVQWTVKGIDAQTLEASRVAARKRGMKFGAWVNQVLRDAIVEESERHDARSSELLQKISEIEQKLERSVGELKQQTGDIQHDVRVLHLLVPKITT